MSYISSLDLTNKFPSSSYNLIVTSDGSLLADGKGNQITSSQITSSWSENVIGQGDDLNIQFNQNNKVVGTNDFTLVSNLQLTQSGEILNQSPSTGVSKIHASIVVNDKIYAGGQTNGKIVVFSDLNDLSNFTASSVTASTTFAAVTYVSSSNKLYFTGKDGIIYSVNPDDINTQSVVFDLRTLNDLTTSLYYQPGITSDDNYIYGATFGDTPSVIKFYKIDASDNSLILTSSVWPDARRCHSAGISTDGNYFFCSTLKGGFAKISTSDLSFEYTASSKQTDGFTDDMYVSKDYVYLANEVDITNYRITISDLTMTPFSNDSSASLGLTQFANFQSYGMFSDGTHLFNGAISFNNIIVYPYFDIDNPIAINFPDKTVNEILISDDKYFFFNWNNDDKLYQFRFDPFKLKLKGNFNISDTITSETFYGINYTGSNSLFSSSLITDYTSSIRSVWDVNTFITESINCPSTASVSIDYNTGSYYTSSGFTYNYNIYSYKDIRNHRIYSQNFITTSVVDDNSGDFLTLNVTWSAVTGVDGYLIQTKNGFICSDYSQTQLAGLGCSFNLQTFTTSSSIIDDGITTPSWVDVTQSVLSHYGVNAYLDNHTGNFIITGSVKTTEPLTSYISQSGIRLVPSQSSSTGSFQLYNPTTNSWYYLTLSGSSGNEVLKIYSV